MSVCDSHKRRACTHACTALIWFWAFPLSSCTWRAYREAEVTRSIIQKYLQMHKARCRQDGTWSLCLSAFQCVSGVNIYFTLLYTSKKEKKRCFCDLLQVSSLERKRGDKKRNSEGDLRDLSMYLLHNLFICLEEIDRGCSLSGTHWQLHKYLHNFTHRSLTIHLNISGGQFKVSTFKEKQGG